MEIVESLEEGLVFGHVQESVSTKEMKASSDILEDGERCGPEQYRAYADFENLMKAHLEWVENVAKSVMLGLFMTSLQFSTSVSTPELPLEGSLDFRVESPGITLAVLVLVGVGTGHQRETVRPLEEQGQGKRSVKQEAGSFFIYEMGVLDMAIERHSQKNWTPTPAPAPTPTPSWSRVRVPWQVGQRTPITGQRRLVLEGGPRRSAQPPPGSTPGLDRAGRRDGGLGPHGAALAPRALHTCHCQWVNYLRTCQRCCSCCRCCRTSDPDLARPLTFAFLPASRKSHVHRRGLLELAGTLQCASTLSALAYISYGCHCGLGGRGQPRDPTDWCCHHHDCCYEVVERAGCKPKLDHYSWTCISNRVVCGPTENKCQELMCKCDQEVAHCLAQAEYNLKHLFYPYFLCEQDSPKCN
ncbi:PREDICTED: uncharacterized protein LOC102822467 [Chrysochloris asiatica]|uniref:Uncharacterized protein LOC102822467 n=1 Tax=Chrysochloris asiatica TaxID=185453 RepID=A0A9B0WUC6_CHRAS|nr:PREDICTED: uncharacterized protein LOC102822467 [Chrysochloris asiatica]